MFWYIAFFYSPIHSIVSIYTFLSFFFLFSLFFLLMNFIFIFWIPRIFVLVSRTNTAKISIACREAIRKLFERCLPVSADSFRSFQLILVSVCNDCHVSFVYFIDNVNGPFDEHLSRTWKSIWWYFLIYFVLWFN